jgi:flagellar biosynthesis anti-sigma factor FlgM
MTSSSGNAMRINSYSPSPSADEVSNNPGTPKAGVQGNTSPPAAGGDDRTTLTSDSATVQSLVRTAMNSPAVRQETVESLRQTVASGQYQLDPSAIADAMLADQ